MKYTRLYLSLAAALLLGPAAAGAQEDVYKTLSPGDRVTVTFRNGNTLTGTLMVIPSDGKDRKEGRGDGGGGPVMILYFHQKG